MAKDVCDAFGLANPSQALSDAVGDDERCPLEVSALRSTEDCRSTPQRTYRMSCVSEPGLYSLILRSRKPSFHAFRKWVTSELLPTIRMTGTASVARRSRRCPHEINRAARRQQQR